MPIMWLLIELLIFVMLHIDYGTPDINLIQYPDVVSHSHKHQCKYFAIEEKIDCRYMKLTTLPTNINKTVKILDLSHNLFTSIPEELVNFPQLKSLYITHNRIHNLNPINLSSLEILKLSHNNLTYNSIKNRAIYSMKSLKSLDLSNNHLSQIYFYSLASLSLQSLHLDNCMLLSSTRDLTWLPKLTHLYINYNYRFNTNGFISSTLEYLQITNSIIEEFNFTKLPNLQRADLSGNRIVELYKEYFDNPKLTWLDLSGNVLKSIKRDVFDNLPVLETLNLSTNVFSILSPYMFMHNANLKSLNISKTYLTKMVTFQLPNLEILDISINEIQEFNENNLTSMPSLRALYLSRNLIAKLPSRIISNSLEILDLSTCRITVVKSETFHKTIRLHKLNIAGNRLTELHVNSLPAKLNEIRIDNNPWRCECFSKEFHYLYQYLTEIQNLPNTDLLCQSPENISGLTWHQACNHAWYHSGKALGRSDRLWIYVISMILAMALIFCATMSIRRVYQVKLMREHQEREERRREAQERIQRIRAQQQQNENALQNAPDPRDLIRPPSYAEALRMPSLASLTNSRPSLSASNPDISKRKQSKKRRSKSIHSQRSDGQSVNEASTVNEDQDPASISEVQNADESRVTIGIEADSDSETRTCMIPETSSTSVTNRT